MLDFSAKKIFTIPNLFSLARIAAVPFIGWLLLIDSVPARIAAGVLLVFAILTDFLDGWFARLLDQASDLGRMIDPLADKLFVILLAFVLMATRDFPLWLALVIVGKDALIVVAGVLVAGRKRVMMESNIIGKYAFGFQAGLVVCYFLDFPFGEQFFIAGSLILIAATMISYTKGFLFVIRSPQEVVVVPTPPQIVPTWGRRAIVAVLLLVMLIQGYYWTAENALGPVAAANPTPLPADRTRALAERYAPILVFCEDDAARPVAVEDYLASADLRQGPRWFWGLVDGTAKQGPLAPADLALAGGGAYLRLNDLGPVADFTPMVYAVAFEAGTDGERFTVIQYWMLFPHEEGFAGRSGDWQMAAVYLEDEEHPRYLAVTQGWYATAVELNQAGIRGGRPILYIAPGSHSLYHSAGEHPTYVDEEKIFSLGSETTAAGVELRPGGYLLKIVDDSDESWLSWPGRWGGPQPGGDRGPRLWNPRNARLGPWSHAVEFLRFYLK